MNRKRRIDPDMSLDEIMRSWPVTIQVMLKHRFLCVGCPIAAFHTVADACREHFVDEEVVAADLGRALRSG